jgi:UDP-N-acetylglucosamine--N-acetylmuramyl-(pentapeptide) pyrophosphoryl-undecaprenol N-acetylglucosamine transferase
MEQLDPHVKIVFVGAKNGMEQTIFPRYKYEHHFIKVGRFHSSVGLWQQLKTLCGLPFALLHALSIFRRLQPTAVLGVGGFASGPFVILSTLLGAKTYLWEANAYPGLTNRVLARFVTATFIVFENAKTFLKSKSIIFSGMPVRKEFFAQAVKPDASMEAPSSTGKLKVLLFGGSQGARFINEIFLKFLKEKPQILESIEVVHQIGSRDFKTMMQKYGDLAQRVTVLEYIHDMPAQLKCADFVICRSGASTVAEVVTCRKPALFVPLPTAADNHQFYNAQVVADKRGALLVEQKNLDVDRLWDLFQELLKQPQQLQDMSSRLQEFQFEDASLKIAKAILG